MEPKAGRIRRLLWWNQVWLGVCLVVALGWGAVQFWHYVRRPMEEVRIGWREDNTLRVWTIQGGVVVTHLAGYSPEHGLFAARLPTPVLILDSAPWSMDTDGWNALVWRDERGREVPAPSVGSPVRALYYRAQTTDFSRKTEEDGE